MNVKSDRMNVQREQIKAKNKMEGAMNRDKLTEICKSVSKEHEISIGSVELYYFMESILKSLASSEYGESFVFKGGFLISNVGSKIKLSENTIKQMLKKLSEGSNNNLFQKIQRVVPMKREDKYNGFRVSLLCRVENIKQYVPLDIITEEAYTPRTIEPHYVSVFGEETIAIKSCPIETTLAEKIHTIYSRGLLNSRSKDYYDLYIINKLKNKEVSFEALKEECQKTFLNRETEFDIDKILELLESAKKNKGFKKRWLEYSNTNSYAKDIKVEELLNYEIETVMNMKNV